MLIIHFIRHGESEGNIQTHLEGGRQDHLELTARGEDQVRQLAQFIKDWDVEIHHVITSTAVRARKTAQAVTKAIGHEALPDERIVEISMGEWEGEPRDEIYTPEVLAQRREQGYDWRAPGGESMNEVVQRTTEALEELMEHYDEEESRHILWFGHGGAIRALAGHLLGLDDFVARSSLHNTGRVVLGYNGDEWILHRWNDTKHLR